MGSGAVSRSKALDGLRGLAVLQVVVYHYYLLKPIPGEWYQVLQRLGSVIDGLSLFFVLSGFLIGSHLLAVRDRPGMFRVFYWRRACRILPLYGLLLASYGGLRLVDQHWKLGYLYHWFSEFSLWNYLVFWQNVRMVQGQVLGAAWLAVTWSLAVEVQFYAILPWVVRWVSARWLAGLGLACIGAAIGVRGLHVFDYLLIDRLDALSAGVLLALALRHRSAPVVLARHGGWLRLLVVTYLVSLFVVRLTGLSSLVLRSQTTSALVFAAWIALLTDGSSWRIMLPAVEWFAPLGLLSYFIYLFHMPVAYVFDVSAPAAAAAALPVTVGLAVLSYHYIEQPVIRWGRRHT